MSSILDVLNKEQREAVEHIDGNVMVFAGAGTGKTKTLTARIAYMVSECDIKPYNILAITFTNKATNEMKERLEGILEDKAKLLHISTIHSLCTKILRRNIDKIGYSRSFEIIDEEDVQKILSDILKEEGIEKKALSPKVCAKLISDAKNGIHNLDGVISHICRSYTSYLKTNNLLDFDDLLLKTKELFTSSIETLVYYQDLFHYILVDEFQDVNSVQYDIIKMLSATHQNLFVVGDDDQSIYSFRGATPYQMLNFKNDYPDAFVVTLVQNYRSRNTILKGANAVIKNNQTRQPKELYSNIPGSNYDVVVQEAYYYEEEVRFVTNEIAHLVHNQGFKYSDIAVLYRNSALSRNFELSFIEERIPYNVYGGFSYMKRKEIKDVISYFKFIIDPNRINHFKRIINLTPRGIGEKTISNVVTVMEENDCSLFEAIDIIYENNPSTKNHSLVDFKDMIIKLSEKIEEMSLVNFFDYMMIETGYLKVVEEDDKLNDTNRVDNLNEFKSILYNIEFEFSDTDLSKKDMLRIGIDDLMLDQSFDSTEKANGVTLSTIHSVKGLEYEVVFIVALEEGIFPSIREDVEIEEERRVAYVAFTRAKTKIYISCAQRRLIYGRIVQNKISRFLTEYLSNDDVREGIKESIKDNETIHEMKVGAKVNHKYFGYGTVVSMDDEYVQIIFDKDQTIKKIKKDYPYIKVLG